MTMIRIGVVGGGTYGDSHLAVFRDLEDQGTVQLAALAETHDERRELRRL